MFSVPRVVEQLVAVISNTSKHTIYTIIAIVPISIVFGFIVLCFLPPKPLTSKGAGASTRQDQRNWQGYFILSNHKQTILKASNLALDCSELSSGNSLGLFQKSASHSSRVLV